jgi:shikimate kinase
MPVGNIVLTGFMGTGKSTVARELARLTGMLAVELDAEIEQHAAKSIPEIFSSDGEDAFRDMESLVLARFMQGSNQVISTGGGAVIRQDNRDAMSRGGVVICLTATASNILARTGGSDRPLLKTDDPLAKIEELLAAREAFYHTAEVIIETGELSPLQIAQEILSRIGWKK